MISCIQRILFRLGNLQKNIQFKSLQQAQDYHKAVLATRIIKLIQNPQLWVNQQIIGQRILKGHSSEKTIDLKTDLQQQIHKRDNLNQSIQVQDQKCPSSLNSKKTDDSSDTVIANIKLKRSVQNIISKETSKEELTKQVSYWNKQKFQTMSLQKKVIKSINDYKKSQKLQTQEDIKLAEYPEQRAKKYLMSYFIEGVWVHNIYCSQNRFKSSDVIEISLSQIKNRNQVFDQSFLQQQDSPQLYQKLTFFPSHLVTTQAFNSFNFSVTGYLLTGHFGIGKTYSFILYKLLSDIIFRYKHKYCDNLHQLPSEIDFTLPKLVYWSILFENKNYFSLISKIIERQCYQLKNFKLKDGNIYSFEQQLLKDRKKTYQFINYIFNRLGIRIIFMFDQINLIAKAIRDYHSFLNLYYQEKTKKQYFNLVKSVEKGKLQQQQLWIYESKIKQRLTNYFGKTWNQIKSQQQKARDILQVIQCLISQFQRIIYLSSQTIQRHLLKNLNLTGQDSHSPIQIRNFSFLDQLNKPSTKADTASFFVMMLKKYIHKINQSPLKGQKYINFKYPSEQYFDQIIKKLYNLLENNQVIISFFTISSNFKEIEGKSTQFLNAIENLFLRQDEENLILRQDEENLTKNLKQIIRSLNNYQIKIISNQIDNFLHKKYGYQVYRDKNILLYRLLLQARKRKQNQQEGLQQKKYLKVKTADLFLNQLNKNQMNQDFTVHLDRQFFDYDQQYGFSCKIHQNVIIQILSKYQRQFLNVLLDCEQKLVSLLDVQGLKGNFLESLIKKIIVENGTNFTWQKDQNNSKQLEFHNMKNIDEVLFFDTIPQINWSSYKNFAFLKGFIEKFEKIGQGNFLFVPKKKVNGSEMKYKPSQTSKLIDFVIVKKTPEKIYIYAFDPTVQKGEYNSKLQRFLKQYSNFQDKQISQITLSDNKKFQVSLKYFVICPQNLSHSENTIDQWSNNLNQSIKQLEKDIKIISNKIKQIERELQQQRIHIKSKEKFAQKIIMKKKEKLAQRLKDMKDLVSKLQNNRSYLKQMVIKKLNAYSFTVEKKNSFNNKKLLLDEVGVCSFSGITLTNTYQNEIDIYLRIFEKLKNDYKK